MELLTDVPEFQEGKMAKRKLFICYPFDKDGKMMDYVKDCKLSPEEEEQCYIEGSLTKVYVTHYAGRDPEVKTIVWRPNREFKATFELLKMEHGCSKKVTAWRNQETGEIYHMFISDVIDLLYANHGYCVLTGTFCFVKRGVNYGIKWLRED